MNGFQEIKNDFLEFISPECNRKDFILNYLKKNGIKAAVLPVQGKNHIYPIFNKSSYNPIFKIKTVIAHYDRVLETPGANDNSFAVFMMLEWAKTLNKTGFEHNIRLIFTDGEELTEERGSASLKNQGAFSLAKLFTKLDILNDDIFVFDCMGRGTIPILGKEIEFSGNRNLKKRYSELQNKAKNLLQKSVNNNFLTLPVSVSDNAGFLASGLPAVIITMLPANEANEYLFNLMKVPELENYITLKKNTTENSNEALSSLLPVTWRLIHSKKDDFSSLTEESVIVFNEILKNLSENKYLLKA